MSHFWYAFIAQTIGILASIISICSYQFKKNKIYLILQMTFGLLISTQFALLKAWGGCIMNLIGMTRALTFAFKDRTNKESNKFDGFIFCVLFVAGSIITMNRFGEIWFTGLAVCFAQIMGTISFVSDDPKTIRLFQLFFVAPFWLFYDIFYFSIGGIITESFVVVSIIVSLIRFKFGKTDK